MRVTLVSSITPNPPGEANYAYQFFRELQRAEPDWKFQVVSFALDSPQPEQLSGVNIVRSLRRGGWARHLNFLRVLVAIVKFRPDVVHFQSPVIPDYGGKFGEPMLLAFVFARLLGIQTVITLHSTWFRPELEDLATARGLSRSSREIFVRYYQLVVRSFARICNSFNVLCAGVNSPLLAKFVAEFGLPSHKVGVEPHPCTPVKVSLDPSAVKRNLGIPSGRLICAFGFVREDKGFHHLVSAFSRLSGDYPDVHLLIAGRPARSVDEIYAKQLETQVEATGSNRIHLRIGFVPEDQLQLMLIALDILVVPYLMALGASGPAHQVLGTGKPVIISEIGHNIGLIGTCPSYPPGDVAALETKLRDLLGKSNAYQDVCSLATEYASDHSWAQLARAYAKHYQLLRNGKAPFRFAWRSPE